MDIETFRRCVNELKVKLQEILIEVEKLERQIKK